MSMFESIIIGLLVYLTANVVIMLWSISTTLEKILKALEGGKK